MDVPLDGAFESSFDTPTGAFGAVGAAMEVLAGGTIVALGWSFRCSKEYSEDILHSIELVFLSSYALALVVSGILWASLLPWICWEFLKK